MKVLITGATGYIGGHLLHRALERGHQVKALVLKNTPHESFKTANVELVFGDLVDGEGLKKACSDVDVIYNAAGLLGKWGTTTQQLYQVNVEGVRNLIETCRGINLRHVVHLSATGVTGPLRDEIADETYECKPTNPYTQTKFQGELLALRDKKSLFYERSILEMALWIKQNPTPGCCG